MKHEKIRCMVGVALLIAIVVVLQLVGSFIKFGPVSISLVLVPIVVGAAVYGPAAGAILGIVVSTAAGSLFLWAYNRRRGDGISAQMLEQAVPAATGKEILKQLWTIAVPICLGALALNITTLIDVSSLTNRLSTALANGEEALLSMYDGILPADMPREEIPNYLFGAYNMSVTLFNLIPALTTTFGVSALPSVTAAWTSQNRRMLQKNIRT